jgi:hypothetical protein
MGNVYIPSTKDISAAAHTMVTAFLGDPFNKYFYNLVPDQRHRQSGTEEMTALEIYSHMKDALVLAVDDGDQKCAGVALWVPPRLEPIGWFDLVGRFIRKCALSLVGRFYYRNRGTNRQVGSSLNESNLAVSRV